MDRQRLISAELKMALWSTPYFGEIAWQLAGAPGRENFEPLQHLGNVGMGAGGTVFGLIVMEGVAGLIAAQTATPETGQALREEAHRKLTLGALVIGAASQVYAETLGTGTHDIIDMIYGIGSVVLGVTLFDRIRQWDFRTWHERRGAHLRNRPRRQEARDNNLTIGIVIDDSLLMPEKKYVPRGSSDAKRARRKMQASSRKANRGKK